MGTRAGAPASGVGGKTAATGPRKSVGAGSPFFSAFSIARRWFPPRAASFTYNTRSMQGESATLFSFACVETMPDVVKPCAFAMPYTAPMPSAVAPMLTIVLAGSNSSGTRSATASMATRSSYPATE